jgi:hypothetical protein
VVTAIWQHWIVCSKQVNFGKCIMTHSCSLLNEGSGIVGQWKLTSKMAVGLGFGLPWGGGGQGMVGGGGGWHHWDHRVHRVATVAFRRTFNHEGKN